MNSMIIRRPSESLIGKKPLRRFYPLVALLMAVTIVPIAAKAAGGLNPTGLRCEFHTDPLGLGETHPRLDWTLTAVDPKARGLSQTAYEIVAATSPEKLESGQPDLWDSGKIASGRMNQIEYSGRPLTSREAVWWKVRVWDQTGAASDWSMPARWTMGLLAPADWKADWIGLDAAAPAGPLTDGERARLVGVPFVLPSIPGSNEPVTIAVRRGFTLPPGRKVARVTFIGTADQIADVSINGHAVGRMTRWDAVVPFDLTPLVVPGDNVLGLQITQQDGRLPSVQGELEIIFADGLDVWFPTNETWHFEVAPKPGWDKVIPREDNWRPMVVTQSGLNRDQFHYLPPAPYLRRGFTVAKPVRRATLYATALGEYEVHINGARVGQDYFTPGWTDYHHRVPYETYDVTGLVHQGDNAVGAILGDGWYAGVMGNAAGQRHYGGYARFAAQLEIEYGDGSTQRVTTDGDWRAKFGPIVYADHLKGCAWDDRLDLGDWASAGYDDSTWSRVATGQRRSEPGPAPKIVIEADTIDPIRITDTLAARAVTEPKPGVYVVDFGQNHTGWVRLKVKGKAGQKITIRHGEGLNSNGTVFTSNLTGAAATDIFWLRGGGEETLEPKFTFHSFRYAEITGLDAAPEPAAVCSLAASSVQTPTGGFSCSDPLLNKLFSTIVWTQKSDSFSTTIDCPNRGERLGWTGDAQLFLPTAAFNYNVAPFMERWLESMRDGQGADGLYCKVNPFIGGDEPMTAWSGDAAVITTDVLWRVYGDTRVIEKNFDALARYMDWLQLSSQHGISSIPVGPGDWLNLGGGAKQEVMDTAYLAYESGLMSEMAAAIGRKADSARYADLKKKTDAAFEQAFVLPDGSIRDSSQTGYALAFTQNLIPDDLREKAAAKFANEIATRDWHLATGLIGTPRLLPALHLAGRDDIAYRLLLQQTYPGWLYMVKNGSGTIWESWNGYSPERGMLGNSLNHVAFGSVGEFLYHYIAGLDTDGPGFQRILIHPVPGSSLTSASATYDAITGHIETGWKIDGGKFMLDAVIPPTTTASICIPVAEGVPVTESGTAAQNAPGVKFTGADTRGINYEVGSGSYHFEVRRPVPTYSNIPYGPDPHNLLDIYLPPNATKATKPVPVVIWYNGIWRPSKNVPASEHFVPNGVAAISAETRAMDETVPAGMKPPISGVLLDGRRAVQFVRLHAAEWNIDPNRIAVAGGSQGTLVALFVGCSGDKANPASADPVDRTSSRVSCIGNWMSQPSIDPKRMQEWVPGVEWGWPALGGKSFADTLARRDELLPTIKQWSPDWLINRETPPIYFEYIESMNGKAPAGQEMGWKVHHPLWGIGFKKLADEQGVTCYLRYPGQESTKYKDLWDFLVEELTHR